MATAGDDPLLVGWDFPGRDGRWLLPPVRPHWAPPAFVAWEGYPTLWQNIANWAAGSRG